VKVQAPFGFVLFRSTEADRFDPQFEWCGHAYFSSRAFACKRNVIHFEKWMEAESWGKEIPTSSQASR
jgi:hypothetical protein